MFDQKKTCKNPKEASFEASIVTSNKVKTTPIITIPDIGSNDNTNPATSNNHNNDPIESINVNPINNMYHSIHPTINYIPAISIRLKQ